MWSPKSWENETRIGARWLKSGKYNTCVFKGHVGITFWGGIVAQTGPHLGVDHDSRIWNDTQVLFPMRPGEWGLGDLAYEHCERIFSGRTMPSGAQAMLATCNPWTDADVFMKNFIAFYRARVESVIHRLKNHGWCETAFRGSYSMLVALHDIAVITTALEIKLEFELDNKAMFEVVGPLATHNKTE